MGYRRRARELAMQALYYMDIGRHVPADALDLFRLSFPCPQKVQPFFDDLVHGVMDRRVELDAIIERFSSNWKVSRMSCVDRNIIRIAVYEILHCEDIPTKVSINEAIDVAKKYGTEESGAFINGILDSIRKELGEKRTLGVPENLDPQPSGEKYDG